MTRNLEKKEEGKEGKYNGAQQMLYTCLFFKYFPHRKLFLKQCKTQGRI